MSRKKEIELRKRYRAIRNNQTMDSVIWNKTGLDNKVTEKDSKNRVNTPIKIMKITRVKATPHKIKFKLGSKDYTELHKTVKSRYRFVAPKSKSTRTYKLFSNR